MTVSPELAPFSARVAFLVELATHLHAWGTTAQRLEGALLGVAQRLAVECEPWTNPTGMILSFRDPADAAGMATITRVIRLPPGDTDLYRLSETDRIADEVLAGRMDLVQGHAALQALKTAPPRVPAWADTLAFGLTAGAVAAVMRLPWLDIGTAAVAGLGIGLLYGVQGRHPVLREASEALAGVLAASVAMAVALLLGGINLNTVIIASLVVLLPGMAFTNAVNELTSQHLIAGTARFAGALTTVLKLAVGTMVVVMLVEALGLHPVVRAMRPQPGGVEALGLLLAAPSFAILFRAARRDMPLVAAASIGGYLISKYAAQAWGPMAGVFLAALIMTALGNAYGRWANRPGAIVRLPGIIMLVPGSLSLRSLITMMQQQDIGSGQAALLSVLNTLLALIAGLLFGNLLIPARRNL